MKSKNRQACTVLALKQRLKMSAHACLSLLLHAKTSHMIGALHQVPHRLYMDAAVWGGHFNGSFFSWRASVHFIAFELL
jgi:hypothetical protein